MSDRRNDRDRTVEDRLCHDLFVECPQVFQRSASPSDYDDVDKTIKHPDGPRDALCSPFTLHLCRAE